MNHRAVSEDVDVAGSGYTLPSTICLPAGDGPAPCIVFFAGSGPSDRDWRSPLLPGTNGSGAQLALALQARGVGSIRFDKVGSGVANHVYKSETRAPSTISQAEIAASYADENHALADGLVDAIVDFVTTA